MEEGARASPANVVFGINIHEALKLPLIGGRRLPLIGGRRLGVGLINHRELSASRRALCVAPLPATDVIKGGTLISFSNFNDASPPEGGAPGPEPPPHPRGSAPHRRLQLHAFQGFFHTVQ